VTVAFYRFAGGGSLPAESCFDPLHRWRLWTPMQGGIVPIGLPLWPFVLWTGMHHLRLFANREYGVFLIYRGERLLHRSGVFPRYRRFPFMAKDDLQIGDVWTDPASRHRGLASFAIRQILCAKAKPGRSIWYVVESSNLPSVRMVEKLGFLRVGMGTRCRRPGLSFLDRFVMDQYETSGSAPCQ
jgi:RimJ/RimL family protein N-acetyltransferase